MIISEAVYSKMWGIKNDIRIAIEDLEDKRPKDGIDYDLEHLIIALEQAGVNIDNALDKTLKIDRREKDPEANYRVY